MITSGEKNWQLNEQILADFQAWRRNKGLTSKKNLYTTLQTDSSWRCYLPAFNSRCFSLEYIAGIFLKKVFTIKTDDIKLVPNPLRKKVLATSDLLLFEIESFLNKHTDNFNLGFTAQTLADRDWLLDVLFTLNPENALFDLEQHTQNNIFDHLLDDTLVGDETYSKNKHPAFKKYLYAKKQKRLTKSKLKLIHSNKIEENKITRVNKILKKTRTPLDSTMLIE